MKHKLTWSLLPVALAVCAAFPAPALADTNQDLLKELGADVALVKPADALSKKKSGPFSLILIDGAAELLPPFVAASLAADGRVVTGTVTRGITRLAAGRKSADGVALLSLAEIGMPVITEFAASKQWSF